MVCCCYSVNNMGVFVKKKTNKHQEFQNTAVFLWLVVIPAQVHSLIQSLAVASRVEAGDRLWNLIQTLPQCCCPISSFSFSSELNSLKEKLTARSKFIFIKLTSLQSI